MKPLEMRSHRRKCRQSLDDHLIDAGGALAAADHQNHWTRRVKAERYLARAPISWAKTRTHRGPRNCNAGVLQSLRRRRKTDKGAIDHARKPAVGAARNRIRLMEKRARPAGLGGEHRRSAGKT